MHTQTPTNAHTITHKNTHTKAHTKHARKCTFYLQSLEKEGDKELGRLAKENTENNSLNSLLDFTIWDVVLSTNLSLSLYSWNQQQQQQLGMDPSALTHLIDTMCTNNTQDTKLVVVAMCVCLSPLVKVQQQQQQQKLQWKNAAMYNSKPQKEKEKKQEQMSAEF